MRGFPRFLAAAAPLALILSTSGAARADLIDVGVGVVGAFGGNFIDKPSDKSYPPFGNDPTSYPGFGGTNYGGGLAFDVRVLKFVGVEIDVLRQKDKGHADWSWNKRDYTIDIGQSAWHIPVLAKGVIPLPLFAPFVVLGADFVKPSDGEGDISPTPAPFAVRSKADSYTMLVGGIGFEIKLPAPGIDVRIPFQIRASFTPGASDKLVDQQKLELNGATVVSSEYNSAWKYQAQATLGAQVYF